MSSIREECGVFGVISEKPANVAGICYYGLYALQHRGQESCGIVVNDDGLFVSRKDLGLVSEVFSGNAVSSLPQGTMAVAHTRYGTTGGTSRSNCQPIEVNHQKGHMAIAHNGNLSNAAELRSALELSGAIFHTSSDTESIAYIVTKERLRAPSIEEALSRAMDILDGAYSLVMMSPQKLICARDPYGFRPLCYGRTKDGMYVAASESCALTAVGAEFIRDVEPGEILIFSKDGIVSRREHCNQESGIPYGIGLIKNKYIGRTFIAPGDRFDQVKIKLSAVEEVIKDKNIVLIDDSIVRGTTSGRIVSLLRETGAKAIHMRISSPPFLYPCYYGTDIDSRENLIACHHSVSEIAGMIGADSLGFLPDEALKELSGNTFYCSACFDGRYPTKVPEDTGKNQFEQRLSEKNLNT